MKYVGLLFIVVTAVALGCFIKGRQAAGSKPDVADAAVSQSPADSLALADDPKSATVPVHVFNRARQFGRTGRFAEGRAIGWRVEEAAIAESLRCAAQSGNRAPGSGDYVDTTDDGVYCFAGCGLPLFASDAKFHSGTGWPSFYQPIAKGNVAETTDTSDGMTRTEIHCPRCGGHLGHVFDDGPKPTGLRTASTRSALRFMPR